MHKWIYCCLILSSVAQATPITHIGSLQQTVLKTPQSILSPLQKKHVFVEKIALSSEAKTMLSERLSHLYLLHDELTQPLPSQVYLGMNKTPVLDQGEHGACVMFTITGALDAIIGKGDYVSQLCSLELGTYLKSKRKIPMSGWDGSTGPVVLNQLHSYGLISKGYQHAYGCAGVKYYPLNDEHNRGKPMSVSEYTANAFSFDYIAYYAILANSSDVFSQNYSPQALLSTVKKHVSEGKRVSFGMLLDDTNDDAGIEGSYKVRGDTWVLTQDIINKGKQGEINSAHQMIIIGYDDQAVAYANDGARSKGLLILRNSWGKDVGNQGNFYMSYEYFIALSDGAEVIIPSQH